MSCSDILIAEAGSTIVVRNISCLITMSGDESESNPEKRLGLETGVDLVISDGKVTAIGYQAGQAALAQATHVLDGHRWVVMPGLVDAHVHPLFAGSRAQETVLKARGVSYEEIAARGGGIAATTRATREASAQELTNGFLRHAHTALSRGVVLMDAKTGYGLSPAEEDRHLRCLISACERPATLRPHVAATLLGPHAASPDFTSLSDYLNALIEALPRSAEIARKAVQAGVLVGVSADIFVERNYFTKEHADRWLGAALQHGLDIHVHADEFSRSGGCEIAVEMAAKLEQTKESRRGRARVLSVDHCQYATDTDLALLAARGIVATALPTTSFISNIPFVDARKWRESGVRAAIASDFNPGSAPINNLWFAAYLGLTRCGFHLHEVLRGITRNAARALGAEASFGSIAVGRPGHIIAFQGHQPEDFFASPLGDHLELVVRGPSV